MKRKILTGLASLTLLDIAAAHAADVARPVYKAPQVVAAAPSWTGWYLGGHVGYRWTNPDLVTAPYTAGIPPFSTTIIPSFSKGMDLDGVIGGVHLGYNWQVDRNWLVGIEGDLSAGSQSDSAAFSGRLLGTDGFTTRPFSRNSELTLQWQASIRGRLGYIVDTWLWYVTGGVAFEHAKWSDTAALGLPGGFGSGSASWSASKTLTGWVIGAGVEQMLSPNWMWRAEYLYENFGDFNVPYGIRGVSTAIDMDNVHKLRLGLTYKFGDPGKGPVVAKY